MTHTNSICIATYNGAEFILEQINSILIQLDIDDEIIVVDDCSTDQTISIIESLNDNRIKIYRNDVNRGHVFSFGRAIALASNEIIFMSDQDDRWVKSRLRTMADSLVNSGKLLLASNNSFMDRNGNPILFSYDGVASNDSGNYVKNILDIYKGKTNYFGCAMAFRRELLDIILPIPDYVESHDLWIALAGNLLEANVHIDQVTLLRRIHTKNASVVQRKIIKKIWSRWIFTKSIIELRKRILKVSNAVLKSR